MNTYLTSIIQRLMEVFLYLMIASASIGKIQTDHANLSEKDTKHAMLKDFDSPFVINVDLYK